MALGRLRAAAWHTLYRVAYDVLSSDITHLAFTGADDSIFAIVVAVEATCRSVLCGSGVTLAFHSISSGVRIEPCRFKKGYCDVHASIHSVRGTACSVDSCIMLCQPSQGEISLPVAGAMFRGSTTT